MALNVFNELFFDVKKEVFYQVLENPDKGFGFRAKLEIKHLTPLQIEVLDFLLKCYKKRLLGNVTITFRTEAIGEIQPLERKVEGIEKTNDAFIIINTY